MAASKTSPLWIENEVQKCFQQSENMETFEIAIAILSGKLQFIRDSIFNSKKSVIYLTPKKRKFEVIFRRLEPEMIVSCYGKRRKVLDEIYEIARSEEHTSELQSRQYLVCRLLLEKKKKTTPLHLLPLT